MLAPTLLLPLIAAASAFGATGIVLALMGAGMPFLLAALLASACAGLVVRAAMPRPAPVPDVSTNSRIDAIEAQAAILRHDLRGALSPALMVSDRLTSNPDPAVRRAGEAVVRSVERATALLSAAKSEPKAD